MYDELVKRVRQVAEEVCDDYDVDPYNAEQRSFVIEEAADVRPVVRGVWKKADVQPYFRKHFDIFVCSNCHARGQTKWNFCPNCGADMRGEQDV